MSRILNCLIPDLWPEQSVHWETRLGLVGLKRLLAENNPIQRNEPSKVTAHLTKRKIGLQWTESCLSTTAYSCTVLNSFHLDFISILRDAEIPTFFIGQLTVAYNNVVMQNTLHGIYMSYTTHKVRGATCFQPLVSRTSAGVPSWHPRYLSMQCGRDLCLNECVIQRFPLFSARWLFYTAVALPALQQTANIKMWHASTVYK